MQNHRAVIMLSATVACLAWLPCIVSHGFWMFTFFAVELSLITIGIACRQARAADLLGCNFVGVLCFRHATYVRSFKMKGSH